MNRRKNEEDEKVNGGDKMSIFDYNAKFSKKFPAAKCMIKNASHELISYIWCIFPLRKKIMLYILCKDALKSSNTSPFGGFFDSHVSFRYICTMLL